MRKRAQRKSIPVTQTPSVKKIRTEKKPIHVKKNWWIALSLVGIFFLVLFLNAYFNLTSEVSINQEGTGFNKFYLSGPDPYYNMRLVETTVETGKYPFYSDTDPLLNYPLGESGGRPPLLNMLALGFSRFLVPFMSETDAIGYSMQFLPALFGALLIFPVYYLGKTLFGRKEGLVAAFLIPLIAVHIGSGHGSAYSLFDHDSFNLLLFFISFLFLIKGVKEKDAWRSVLYALLAGVSLAALSLTWVQAQFLYVVIALYAVVQMLIDIFTDKIEPRVFRTAFITLLVGYLLTLPVRQAKFGLQPDLFLFMCLIVAIFGLIYLFLHWRRLPWIISLSGIFCLGIGGLVFLYLVPQLSSSLSFLSPLRKLSEILFGAGIYGNKVSETIAEAGTFGISRTVMSFGPGLYWLGWGGFILLIYFYYQNKLRRDYLFIILLFLVDIWLTTTAGRFLNDLVPIIAILGGWIVWLVIDKIDYKQMIKNVKSAGGGLHGLRRGIKAFHLIGIIFLAFLVILPNGFLALDAAVPTYALTQNGTSTIKVDMFGEDHSPIFGLNHFKEGYWVDAFLWLSEQDTEIEDSMERPAFISWWDYGFYGSAVSEHPMVADNFQDGIPPASNFHTSTSEKEAVTVWIVRLLEGNVLDNGGILSAEVVDVLNQHIGINETSNISTWMADPTSAPSYWSPIGEEYDPELSKQYPVGEQWPENAVYHDIVRTLNKTLDEEGITWLYHDIQEATGYSIRYYGVEGYDKQIFNIFGFLADKSNFLPAIKNIRYSPPIPTRVLTFNPEDDFVNSTFTLESRTAQGGGALHPTLDNVELSFDELIALSDKEKKETYITDIQTNNKDAYFDTMFYRTYVGLSEGEPGKKQEPQIQLPCIDQKHFYAEYISNISQYPFPGTSQAAVVIAKYYEGAYVKGNITYKDAPIDALVVVQKNITHYGQSIPIDHDKTDTVNGSFNVIAPAGNITLQIRRYPELGVPVLGGTPFIIKNVTFNSLTNPELFPISDAEAMRKNGSNYERILNITIEPASIDGYVYINTDDNDTYNTSSDTPLADVTISVHELLNLTVEGQATTILRDVLTTDKNGYYNTTDLMPGYYIIRAELDEFLIHETSLPLYSGNNTYNISQPKPASLTGTVFYDINGNGLYDSREEISNADIELLYNKLDMLGNVTDQIKVSTMQTNDAGVYLFDALHPGQYVVNVTKLNVTTGYLDYAVEQQFELVENTTSVENISLEFASVTVSGYTRYGDEDIGLISIAFTVNESVENNTAAELNTRSRNVTGFYELPLSPGAYNVTVTQDKVSQGIFSFSGQLEIRMGEGFKTYNIALIKDSIPVLGNTTTEDGTHIGNIDIRFDPDPSVENNTARFTLATSNDQGRYSDELLPGSYNVTVQQTTNVTGINITYTFTGYLTIQSDDERKTLNVVLASTEEE